MKKIFFFLFCVVMCCNAQNIPWFQSSAVLKADKSPLTLVSADFNADGKADIAAGNYASNVISVFLGGGNGLFSGPVNYFLSPSTPAWSKQYIASGDFNNDGKVDLVVAVQSSFSIVFSVFEGTGTGTFLLPNDFGSCNSYTISSAPNSILVADYNGDGNDDIALGFLGAAAIIFQGNGNGSFSSCINNSIPNYRRSLINGDFNGDGYLDLSGIGGFSSNQGIYVLLGGSSGTFGLPITTSFNPPWSNFITAGNFNSDNKQDIVLTHLGLGTVQIFLAANGGSFSTGPTYSVYGASYTLAKDLDNDSKSDLAVVGAGKVSLLKGNGDGSFLLEGSYSVHQDAASIISTDVNGDGAFDLIVGSGVEGQKFSTDTISILYNQRPVGIPKHISLDVQDVLIYPNPSKGYYSVVSNSSMQNLTVEVFNMLGLRVRKFELMQKNYLLDLQDQPEGVYTAMFTKGSTISYLKIVKE
jgi:hypothetical protein